MIKDYLRFNPWNSHLDHHVKIKFAFWIRAHYYYDHENYLVFFIIKINRSVFVHNKIFKCIS